MISIDPDRTRTITWDDPLGSAEVGARMNGLDYLRLVASGKLPPPPISSLLGMTIDELEVGRARSSTSAVASRQRRDGSWTARD